MSRSVRVPDEFEFPVLGFSRVFFEPVDIRVPEISDYSTDKNWNSLTRTDQRKCFTCTTQKIFIQYIEVWSGLFRHIFQIIPGTDGTA